MTSENTNYLLMKLGANLANIQIQNPKTKSECFRVTAEDFEYQCGVTRQYHDLNAYGLFKVIKYLLRCPSFSSGKTLILRCDIVAYFKNRGGAENFASMLTTLTEEDFIGFRTELFYGNQRRNKFFQAEFAILNLLCNHGEGYIDTLTGNDVTPLGYQLTKADVEQIFPSHCLSSKRKTMISDVTKPDGRIHAKTLIWTRPKKGAYAGDALTGLISVLHQKELNRIWVFADWGNLLKTYERNEQSK